ncbi:MAG: DUF5654 family protein [Patescibacteria group bacterium]|jgi:hypothetical protein
MPEELKKQEPLPQVIKTSALGYITAGFGLVAGLAWNEAIKSLIEYLFPLNSNSVLAKFIYALAMTVILVVITFYLSKIFKQQERK